jgi:hypothetical protein
VRPLFVLLWAALVVGPIEDADARGLAGAAAKRVLGPGKNLASTIAGPRAATTAGKTADVVVSRRQHPEAAAYIDHAQRNGQPTILTIDRARAAEQRAAALRGVRDPGRKSGATRDRDEYPPAFTKEGGHNSTVHYISPHDNRGAGASMAAQTRDLSDGARIRVLIGPLGHKERIIAFLDAAPHSSRSKHRHRWMAHRRGYA